MSGQADSEVDAGLQYVLLVLSNAEDFKPDYHAVAAAAGMTSANTAQKKFKKLVETAGFQLVNGAVVAAGFNGAGATPKKPRAKAKKTPESALKKRKLEETEDAEAAGCDTMKNEAGADRT